MAKQTPINRRRYWQLRRRGWRPSAAADTARTETEWNRLEAAGLVRFNVEPDDSGLCWEDLEGDTFNPSAHPEIPAERIERERKTFHEHVERWGVWYVAAEYRTDPDSEEWEHGGSVGGVVGDPEPDALAEVEGDVKWECIRELRRALRTRAPYALRAAVERAEADVAAAERERRERLAAAEIKRRERLAAEARA